MKLNLTKKQIEAFNKITSELHPDCTSVQLVKAYRKGRGKQWSLYAFVWIKHHAGAKHCYTLPQKSNEPKEVAQGTVITI